MTRDFDVSTRTVGTSVVVVGPKRRLSVVYLTIDNGRRRLAGQHIVPTHRGGAAVVPGGRAAGHGADPVAGGGRGARPARRRAARLPRAPGQR